MAVGKFGRGAACWLSLGALVPALLLWSIAAREPVRAPADRTDFSAVLSAWRRATVNAFPRDLVPSPVTLPSDHGVHLTTPAELWNVLIRLASGERDFALRVSFARLGAAPEPARRASQWAAHQFFRSFIGVTDSVDGRDYAYERYARGVLGLSGADADPPRIRVAGNSLQWRGGAQQGGDPAVLILQESGFTAELHLSPAKPATTTAPPPAGGRRWQGYVLPRYAAEGVLVVQDRTWTVSGEAWLSHTWGDLPPVGGQIAFHRWTLLLDDGSELALLRMQRRDGSGDASLQGLRIAPDGTAEALSPGTVELQSVAGHVDDLTGWRLRVADPSIDLTLVPWIQDRRAGQRADGRDRALYVERTGAAGRRIGWGFMEPDGY